MGCDSAEIARGRPRSGAKGNVAELTFCSSCVADQQDVSCAAVRLALLRRTRPYRPVALGIANEVSLLAQASRV